MKSKLILMTLIGLALVLFARRVECQEFEYGSPSDLRGVTRIFIATGDDLESQQNIAKHVLEDVPTLTLCDGPESAQVILFFGRGLDSQLLGIYSTDRRTGSATIIAGGGTGWVSGQSQREGFSIPMYQTTEEGFGRVVKIQPNRRPRLVLEFKGKKIKGTIWKRPSSKFASAFVKAFRKANDL